MPRNFFTRTDFPYFVIAVSGSNEDVLPLSEIKEWLRIDAADTDEDGLLTELRDGVFEYFEKKTGMIILETDFRTTRDMFYNRSCFQMRKRPFISLVSFEYRVNGVLTAVPSATYYEVFNDENDFSKLNLNYGATWPSDIDRREQAIEIQFKAGLNGLPDGVPSDLINAFKAHIASWYEDRGDCDDCKCEDSLPSTAKQVYGSYKLTNFGVPSNIECIDCDLPYWGNYFGFNGRF